MSLCLLIFASTFNTVLICVILFSLFQTPMYSLTDIMVTSYTEKYKLNYGNFKKFVALGWGIGVVIAVPFILIFGLKGFIICSIILVLYFIYITVKREEVKSSKPNFLRDFKISILIMSSCC